MPRPKGSKNRKLIKKKPMPEQIEGEINFTVEEEVVVNEVPLTEEVCTKCGVVLTAYVVGGGKKFCCDKCMEEYFA